MCEQANHHVCSCLDLFLKKEILVLLMLEMLVVREFGQSGGAGKWCCPKDCPEFLGRMVHFFMSVFFLSFA